MADVKTLANHREESNSATRSLKDTTKMKVFVINKNGNPLMPYKPSKARKLLRDGKAKVVGYDPFTIQLQWAICNGL